MRLICNKFTIEKSSLEKIIENTEIPADEILLGLLRNPETLLNIRHNCKVGILIRLAIKGLLVNNFDKKESLKILENLLEIDPKSLSPGNLEIH